MVFYRWCSIILNVLIKPKTLEFERLALYTDWAQILMRYKNLMQYFFSVNNSKKRGQKRDSSIISMEFIKSPCSVLNGNEHDLSNSVKKKEWHHPAFSVYQGSQELLRGREWVFKTMKMNCQILKEITKSILLKSSWRDGWNSAWTVSHTDTHTRAKISKIQHL